MLPALKLKLTSPYPSVPCYAWYFFKSQLTPLPQPKGETFNGQTVIVTGANVGLGLEAARTIVQLGADKVILACRDAAKGEAARADIEASTGRVGVVECWQVDVGSFESVKAFCARAENSLGRLDALIANAGVAIPRYVPCDGGLESTIAVNVVGALLMAVLLLPAMRRTAARFNVEPRVSFVGSDAHQFARFAERHVSKSGDARILDAFYDPDRMDTDRYNVSKVMILMCARELARRLDDAGSGNNPVVVNALNPGMCRSQLFRHTPFPLNWILAVGARIVGRSAEEGARTLVAAAAAGRESHGRYMLDCVVVDGAESPLVRSDEGRAVQVRVFDEIMDELEKVQPGIRKIVAGSA